MSGRGEPQMLVARDASELAHRAADLLLECIAGDTGRISVCLSGGSSPKRLYELLATESCSRKVPWQRLHWFIGDERLVPDTDERNNMAVARKVLLDRFAPAENVHRIVTDMASPEASAQAYEKELKQFYGAAQLDPARPLFDLVLLGVGPDGHTASLFPGYPGAEERERWVIAVPEAHVAPFVPRISLTLPALSSCREMLFLISGAEKQPIMRRLLSGEELPANRARSVGKTVWLLDQAAVPEGFARKPSSELPTALIMMGVSGSGKSTIGQALGERLGWRFEDGDRFHPESNVAKMRAGHPLNDRDRWPWLNAIADEIDRIREAGNHVIIACSALKRPYRDVLRRGHDDVRFVLLNGPQELIAARLAERKGHFMPPGLLTSQFSTLEFPEPAERAIIVSIDAPVEEIVADIVRQLHQAVPASSKKG